MRSRWPLLVPPASALAFLVSLYLPWQDSRTGLALAGSLDGWSAEDGAVAALLALALVGATAAILLRPQLAAGLPIGSLAVGLGYFAVGVGLQLRAEATTFAHPLSGPPGWTGYAAPHYGWAYGAWLGIASGGAAALCGLVLHRRELFRRWDPRDALAIALGAVILVSFLLPWFQSSPDRFPGLGAAAATIAAVVLLLGARWPRRPLTIIVAVLVGGAASVTSFRTSLLYGTWMGVGCAVALVVLEAFRGRPFRMPAVPTSWAAVRTAAVLALIVALFLPWEGLRLPHHTFGLDGWEQLPGPAAGGLALLLLAAPALPYVVETVAAIAFLVAWAGTIETQLGPASEFPMMYGAYVGFAATALLVLTVVVQLRRVRLDRRRALSRALPIAASLCCLSAVVVPTWNVLPELWSFQADAVGEGWFTVVGLLLALYLTRAWTRGGRSTLAALALLALPVLGLIGERDQLGLAWGAWILTGLCLLLVLLGWIEERGGGLENFRVPEAIWRVDRLPGEG